MQFSAVTDKIQNIVEIWDSAGGSNPAGQI